MNNDRAGPTRVRFSQVLNRANIYTKNETDTKKQTKTELGSEEMNVRNILQ